MDEHAGESKEEEVTGEGISRDGFEDSMYKAKAIGFRGQGQGQGHWFSRPRPRPRPRPVVFEAKAKAA